MGIVLLFILVMFGGVAVAAWPIFGIFVVLILSPLKTFGSTILLFAKLSGLFTVGIIFLRSVVSKKKIRSTGIEIPVLIIGGGMVLSFFRTTDTGAVFDALLSLASLYGLMMVIINVIENDKQLLNLCMIYLVSGIYPIVQAILQRIEGPSYLGQQFVRASGSFSLATGLGGFLIPYTLVSLALFFYPGLPKILRLFVLSMFSAGYVALIFTLSRGAFFSVFLGFATLIFLLWPVLRKKGPIVLLLVIIIVSVITQQFRSSVEGRLVNPLSSFFNTGYSTDENVIARNDELSLLVDITLDNNFMGTGIGNYFLSALRYRAIYNAPNLPLDPHNILLYFFGEVGIISALGFFWMIISLAKLIVTSYRHLNIKSSGIAFYLYTGSVAAFVGYSIYLLTHGGFFTNELWISMAFLIVSTQTRDAIDTPKIADRPELRGYRLQIPANEVKFDKPRKSK